jgi:hypothetical protein
MHSEIFLVRIVVCERVCESLSERILSFLIRQSADELNNFVPDKKVAVFVVVEMYATQVLVFLK